MSHPHQIEPGPIPWTETTNRPSVSRETLRRLRIVESSFGGNWRVRYPDFSVSEMYRTAVDDIREVVYARVDPSTKDMLWTLAEDWELTLSEVVEELIRYQFEDES